MEKKITKRDNYVELKGLVENCDNEYKDELLAFIDKEINTIDTRAEKAKVRAAEKKAEGDELRSVVEGLLTSEPQTIDAIFAQIDGEDLTRAKVTARLTQLVKAGIATRSEVTDSENHKVKAYSLVA